MMTGLDYVIFVKRVSIKDLAEELEVSAQLIHHWKSGRREITGKYMEKLTSKFGVGAEYLRKNLSSDDRIELEYVLFDHGETIEERLLDEKKNMRKNYRQLLEDYKEIERELKNKEELKEEFSDVIGKLQGLKDRM